MSSEHDDLEIIKALLVGKNPFTGEIYENEHILKKPEVVGALFRAFVAIRKNTLRAQLPVNAGKSWTYDEELKLVTEFKSGVTLIEIANIHQRTLGAIEARLVKLFGENALTEPKKPSIVEPDREEYDKTELNDSFSISDIYDTISDGSGADAYLGDGIWIGADGGIYDRGR